MERFFFFPLEKKYKSVTGGVKCNQPVRFFAETDASDCALFLKKDGEDDGTTYPMQREAGGFSFTLSVDTPGLYFYRFFADGKSFGLSEDEAFCAGNGDTGGYVSGESGAENGADGNSSDGCGDHFSDSDDKLSNENPLSGRGNESFGRSDKSSASCKDDRFLIKNASRFYGAKEGGEDFHLTVSLADFSTPQKWKGGVFYQIFPDRFHKKGDLPVPQNRVLRPWNDGVPRYEKVNGKVPNNDFFGGNFMGIAEKADYLASLGVTAVYLNPIFRAASNHRYDTGDYRAPDPLLGSEEDFSAMAEALKKRGISVVLDGVFNHTGDDSVYFNKYGNYPGVGAYQSRQSPYFPWYTFTSYPDKYDCWWGIDILPAVKDEEESFRAFIAGENGVLAKWQKLGASGWRLDVADELSDDFIERIRSRVKNTDGSALLIGEVWEEADDKISYGKRRNYLHGKELDGVMNYPLKNAILSAVKKGDLTEVFRVLRRLIDRYPKEVLDVLWNSLSTHDTCRALTVLSGVKIADKAERSRFLLDDDRFKKAENKLKLAAALQYTLPGLPCLYYGDEVGMEGYEDPFCRKCYPWGEERDLSLANYFAKLGAARRKIPLFADGEYHPLIEEKEFLLFERRKGTDAVRVAVNVGFGGYDVAFPVPVTELIGGSVGKKFTVSATSAAIFYRFGTEE